MKKQLKILLYKSIDEIVPLYMVSVDPLAVTNKYRSGEWLSASGDRSKQKRAGVYTSGSQKILINRKLSLVDVSDRRFRPDGA